MDIFQSQHRTLTKQQITISRINNRKCLTRLDSLLLTLLIEVELRIVKIVLQLSQRSHVDIAALDTLTSVVVRQCTVHERKVTERVEELFTLDILSITAILDKTILFTETMTGVVHSQDRIAIDQKFDIILHIVNCKTQLHITAERIAIFTTQHLDKISKSSILVATASTITSNAILKV
jgi:hypothetical protein